MKENIKNIIRKWTCCHEWELEQRIRIVDDNQDAVGYRFLYICKRCGKMKWITS